jgi:hypothetical protein
MRKVQVNQDGLKLNGVYQLLVYADDGSVGGSVNSIKKIEKHLVSSKEIALEVTADETKYLVMSQDQNAGQSHNIKSDNSSFESVEEFTYLGTSLTNHNYFQEEIKRRLKSGNACYNLVQIFYLLLCYPKISRLKYKNYNFACCFV